MIIFLKVVISIFLLIFLMILAFKTLIFTAKKLNYKIDEQTAFMLWFIYVSVPYVLFINWLWK